MHYKVHKANKLGVGEHNIMGLQYIKTTSAIYFACSFSIGGLQQRHQLVSVSERDTGISRSDILWTNEKYPKIRYLPSWCCQSIQIAAEHS